jgi:hypothetical protein
MVNLLDNFSSKNDVFKLKDVFSELEIRVFVEDLEISRHFLFYGFQTNQR